VWWASTSYYSQWSAEAGAASNWFAPRFVGVASVSCPGGRAAPPGLGARLSWRQ
jgi:hypothetical protein